MLDKRLGMICFLVFGNIVPESWSCVLYRS